MTNAGRNAAISALGIVVIGYMILSASEAPSPTLAFLQYVLLAVGVIGLIGSLVKLSRGE